MYKIEPSRATFPHPSPFLLRQNSHTSTPDPTMTTQHRYLGCVKTVSTTPASLTIIPDDSTTPADCVLAVGFSQMQLAEFLYSLAMGERRVSYLLRPGRAGEMLVRDVRIAEGVKVKREAGVADGVGGGMVGKEKSVRVSSSASFGASQHDGMTLEEEARRNARGEFRDRSGDLPATFPAVNGGEGSAEAGRARRDQVEG